MVKTLFFPMGGPGTDPAHEMCTPLPKHNSTASTNVVFFFVANSNGVMPLLIKNRVSLTVGKQIYFSEFRRSPQTGFEHGSINCQANTLSATPRCPNLKMSLLGVGLRLLHYLLPLGEHAPTLLYSKSLTCTHILDGFTVTIPLLIPM